jgi:hypothetical protein
MENRITNTILYEYRFLQKPKSSCSVAWRKLNESLKKEIIARN